MLIYYKYANIDGDRAEKQSGKQQVEAQRRGDERGQTWRGVGKSWRTALMVKHGHRKSLLASQCQPCTWMSSTAAVQGRNPSAPSLGRSPGRAPSGFGAAVLPAELLLAGAVGL